jgi:hypothetical protein
MVYLDILIGFSLVMLVFASAVSVAQTMVKRLFAIKGSALSGPLIAEVERAWWESPRFRALGEENLQHVRNWLTISMRSRTGSIGKPLRRLSVGDGEALLALLRDEGAPMLAHLEDTERAEWSALVDRLGSRWDGITETLAQRYEQHTRRWVFALSVIAVGVFNVDAIRILRVLSVSPTARSQLSTYADKLEKHEETSAVLPGTLSDWQKENFAEIAATGLPLGWDKAALAICRYPDGTAEGRLWDTRCARRPEIRRSIGLSIWLWLVRLLGMLIGAGLIAQGAPFWYSVLDSVFGLKRSTAVASGQLGRTTPAKVMLGAAAASAQPPAPQEPPAPEAQPVVAAEISGRLRR